VTEEVLARADFSVHVGAIKSEAVLVTVTVTVLLGTAYGIWRQNRLDQEVWRVIEDRVEEAEPQLPAAPGPASPSISTTSST
jgi:hypothetical protein